MRIEGWKCYMNMLKLHKYIQSIDFHQDGVILYLYFSITDKLN